MSKFYSSFDFIGELSIPKDDSKFLEVKDNNSGWLGHRLNFGIKESKFNSVFLELYGGYKNNTGAKNVVYTFSQGTKDKKGASIEVPWANRLEKSTLDLVANFKKIVIDTETDFEKKSEYLKIGYEVRNLKYEGIKTDSDRDLLNKLEKEYAELAVNRHEFISEYDAIIALSDVLPKFKDYKFRIQGRLQLNEWKGKYYKKYIPEIIEIVPEDFTNQLKLKLSSFFFKDAVDRGSMKDTGKIYVEGYLQDYVRETKRDEFFPQTFVINTSKLNMEDEKHLALLDVLEGQFNVRGRNLYQLPWEVNIYRGAEVLDSEVALTPAQQSMINVGLAKPEDFAQSVFGENIEEFRLVKPILIDNFKDGAVDTGLKESEALELVCANTGDVKLKDEVNEKDNAIKEVSEPNIDEAIDNLFG